MLKVTVEGTEVTYSIQRLGLLVKPGSPRPLINTLYNQNTSPLSCSLQDLVAGTLEVSERDPGVILPPRLLGKDGSTVIYQSVVSLDSILFLAVLISLVVVLALTFPLEVL